VRSCVRSACERRAACPTAPLTRNATLSSGEESPARELSRYRVIAILARRVSLDVEERKSAVSPAL